MRLNEDALVAYWDGQIGTIELGQRLHPLSPPVPPAVCRALACSCRDRAMNSAMLPWLCKLSETA